MPGFSLDGSESRVPDRLEGLTYVTRRQASQASYQSWNIRRVQSGLRWSRTPAWCSPTRRATSSGGTTPGGQAVRGPRSRRSKGASGPRSQRATGMPNPLLGPAQGSPRGAYPGRPLQATAWSDGPAVFEPRRAAPAISVHQSGVQERSPHLQPAGHARPVDLGQDVLGKVGILIERQRPAERICSGARARGQLPPGQGARPRRRAADIASVEQQSGRSRARRTSPASADAPGPAARRPLGGTA